MSITELFGGNVPFDINADIRINRFDGLDENNMDRVTTIWEGFGNWRLPPYECLHCQITEMHVTDDGWLVIEFDAGDVDYNPQT